MLAARARCRMKAQVMTTQPDNVRAAVSGGLVERLARRAQAGRWDLLARRIERTPACRTGRGPRAHQRPHQPLANLMLALDRLGQVRDRRCLAADVSLRRAVRRRICALVSVR